MFTNDTFVANHSLTSNGYSTFSVSNFDVQETEDISYDAVVEAKQRKKDLLYYRPFSFKLNWQRTVKIKVTRVSLHVGDAIDLITKFTGLKKLIIKLTNGNCGCEKRRQKFNKWFFIPIVKLWFDKLDADDKAILNKKASLKHFKKAIEKKEEQIEVFYDNVKRNIIEQGAQQHYRDTGTRIAYWPTEKQRPQTGCGCNNKFKTSVTHL